MLSLLASGYRPCRRMLLHHLCRQLHPPPVPPTASAPTNHRRRPDPPLRHPDPPPPHHHHQPIHLRHQSIHPRCAGGGALFAGATGAAAHSVHQISPPLPHIQGLQHHSSHHLRRQPHPPPAPSAANAASNNHFGGPTTDLVPRNGCDLDPWYLKTAVSRPVQRPFRGTSPSGDSHFGVPRCS